MIGESVVHATMTELERAGVDLSGAPREACVIGYGAVGRATAQALQRRGYKVFVTDVSQDKLAGTEV